MIPNPSYPTKSRVLEIMNTVAAMGGNTVRSTTLGISIGTPLSIAPTFSSLRDGNSNNSVAFESIDYALFAARQYNLKLIIPLTDRMSFHSIFDIYFY